MMIYIPLRAVVGAGGGVYEFNVMEERPIIQDTKRRRNLTKSGDWLKDPGNR